MIKINTTTKMIKVGKYDTSITTVIGLDTETKATFMVKNSSPALATELVYRELVLINKLVKG